ncbi:MAG: HNH endonuclease [Crinalium sp.]
MVEVSRSSLYDLPREEQIKLTNRLLEFNLFSVTESGCRELQKCVGKGKYGRFQLSKTKTAYLAHRISYEFFNGRIPNGLIVMHSCDNPKCINPDHLSIGTISDNNQDKTRKGRNNVPKGCKHPNAKLSESQVREIKALLKEKMISYGEIGKMYKVAKGTIQKIAEGRTWSHVQ